MLTYKDCHVAVGWPYIMEFIRQMTAFTDDRHAMVKRICMLFDHDVTLLIHSIYCIKCRGNFRFVIGKLLRQDTIYDPNLKLYKCYSFYSRHDISYWLGEDKCKAIEDYVKS